MSRNIKKARITRISKVKADRSLEERVTALEKQLTDMQASRKLENAMINEVQKAMLASDNALCASLSKL
ncbi:hypothetical protein ACBQ54_00350 [Providencia vermicola]|uniref:hypothetical protein n=1 Tax=Providencia vermicola TaxID=333965 RepID=UPI0035254361